MTKIPQLPTKELEAEADQLALKIAEKLGTAEDSDRAFFAVLDSPEALENLILRVFGLAIMTKILKGDMEHDCFRVAHQLCRYAVARKHGLLKLESEVGKG